MKAGNVFGWKWIRKNDLTASISASVIAEEKVRLSYLVTSDDGEKWVDKLNSLGVSECNYGGVRYWFHCPDCSKRGAWLYLRGTEFK